MSSVLSRFARVLLAFEVILLLLLSFSPYGKNSGVVRVYDIIFNPPGDGDCFYASATKACGTSETQSQKKAVFDFLKSHQFDVSIQLIYS